MIEEAKQVAQRLRKRMPQALDSADMDEAADTIDALVAEVERLNARCGILKSLRDGQIKHVEAAFAERDTIAEMNHAQWLALENCKTLAARNRLQDWAQHILRFCNEGGVFPQPLRKKEQCGECHLQQGETERDALVAENEKLRNALEGFYNNSTRDDWAEDIYDAARTAALKESKHG